MIVKLLNVFEELLFLEERLGIKSGNEDLKPDFINDMITVINKTSAQLASVSTSANVLLSLQSLNILLKEFKDKESINYKMKSLIASGINKVLCEASKIIVDDYAEDEFEYSKQLDPLLDAVVTYYCVERRYF